jgi:SAM-dependent methyltransferase
MPSASLAHLKRKQPSYVNLLDIGFGDAKRLKEMAARERSKGRFFVGIELEKQKQFGLHERNFKGWLVLRYGDALDKLKNIPDGCVGAANIDFLSAIKKYVEQPIDQNVVLYANILDEAKRVLRSNGRLFLTVPKSYVYDTTLALAMAGFKSDKIEKVPALRKNITASTRWHFEKAREETDAAPYRIVAVKEEHAAKRKNGKKPFVPVRLGRRSIRGSLLRFFMELFR